MTFPCPEIEDDTMACRDGYLDCLQSNVRIFARDPVTGNLGDQLPFLDGCDPSFIYIDWVDECGNYLGNNVPPEGFLTVTNGIGSEVFDTYLGGVTNRYIYTPNQSPISQMVDFTFGTNDPNGNLVLCSFSLSTSACEVQNLDHVLYSTADQLKPDQYCLDDDEDFLAEILRQNPTVCRWRQEPAEQCVYLEDLEEWAGPTVNVNSNAQLQALMNGGAQAGTCYDGGGGTFTLNLSSNLQTSTVQLRNMTIRPALAGGNLITISGNQIMFDNVIVDLQNLSVTNPIRVNGADFEFIRSSIRNLTATGTGTADGLFIRGHRCNIICSTFLNLISPNGAIRGARWQGASIEGGVAVNNYAENIQATNALTDGEVFVFQEVNLLTPVRVYANRGVNMGKRFVKMQSRNVWVRGNHGHWRDFNGPLGRRAKRGMYDDVGGNTFGGGNMVIKNNWGISDYSYSGGESYFVGSNIHRTGTDNKVMRCNVFEVNSPAQISDYAYKIRNWTNSTNPEYPTNSSLADNHIIGNGGLWYGYWDFGTPNGNNFSGHPNFNTGTIAGGITFSAGTIRNS